MKNEDDFHKSTALGIQDLVNAQVSVNRAVWAANGNSYPIEYSEARRMEYLVHCAQAAVDDLNAFLILAICGDDTKYDDE